MVDDWLRLRLVDNDDDENQTNKNIVSEAREEKGVWLMIG